MVFIRSVGRIGTIHSVIGLIYGSAFVKIYIDIAGAVVYQRQSCAAFGYLIADVRPEALITLSMRIIPVSRETTSASRHLNVRLYSFCWPRWILVRADHHSLPSRCKIYITISIRSYAYIINGERICIMVIVQMEFTDCIQIHIVQIDICARGNRIRAIDIVVTDVRGIQFYEPVYTATFSVIADSSITSHIAASIIIIPSVCTTAIAITALSCCIVLQLTPKIHSIITIFISSVAACTLISINTTTSISSLITNNVARFKREVRFFCYIHASSIVCIVTKNCSALKCKFCSIVVCIRGISRNINRTTIGATID